MLVCQGVQSIYRVKENNKTLKEAPEKIISKLDFKCNFLRIGNEKKKKKKKKAAEFKLCTRSDFQ